MIPALSDAALMSKFNGWDGHSKGYFTETELKRILDLAAKNDPKLLKAEVKRATDDLARERGMSVEGLVTVMRAAVSEKRKKQ